MSIIKRKILTTFVVLCAFASGAFGAPNKTIAAIDALIQAPKTQAAPIAQVATSPRYAVVVFFRSSCPHCQRYVPVLVQVAKQLNLTVYAYSTDGGGLPSLPYPLHATPHILQTFYQGIQDVVPTTFIINTRTLGFTLLGQGEQAPATLEKMLSPYAPAQTSNTTRQTVTRSAYP